MKQRRRTTTPVIAPIVHLWILRILMPLGGHRELVRPRGFKEEGVARVLGLEKWIDPEDFDFDPAVARTRLRELHRQAERTAERALPAVLEANLKRLAALVGISDTECRILGFATMLHHERDLDSAADTLGALSSSSIVDALAALLDLPEREVRGALSIQGVLARSGLLSVDRSGTKLLRGKLDLMSDQFADSILESESDPIVLLRDVVAPSTPARLSLADFGHLDEALAILKPYLAQAVAGIQQGVNIFAYGAPGTGKSELARALAAVLECELFEVASENEDGDPVTGERRLRAYRAAQSFFDRRRAMLLFDVVEDVFGDSGNRFGLRSTAQRRKAWLNRTLEQNRVPTPWLSNSIDGIDPAFMRRFDVLVEVPVPPRAQRERILQATCGDLAGAPTLARMAQAEALAPAVVDRAASVVRAIRGQFDAAGSARPSGTGCGRSMPIAQPLRSRHPERRCRPLPAGGRLARNRSAAAPVRSSRHGKERVRPLAGGPTRHATAAEKRVGPDVEMGGRQRKSDHGRLPPGRTRRRAPDARRDRQLPAQARGCTALLGSHARQRNPDPHGRLRWGVHRIDEPDGGYRCGSAAALRLEDSVRLPGTGPGSADAGALTSTFLELAPPEKAELARVRRLALLTPGDFAALARRHRFTPFTGCTRFVDGLEQECPLKRGKSAGIGFLA